MLEDNSRTPSGVSYVVENRHLIQRAFPDLMEGFGIEPVSDYGLQLSRKLREVAPPVLNEAQIVLLSPGVFNSAYFDSPRPRDGRSPGRSGDLFVEDDRVFMKTVAGPTPVHVIYRRINDDFIDPEVFNKESLLGVPGLMRAVRKGNVTLANAAGTGVADDKAVYAYVPRIIRSDLSEEPILPNVETTIAARRARSPMRSTISTSSGEACRQIRRLWYLRRTEATKAEIEICRDRLSGTRAIISPAHDQPVRLPDARRRRGRAAPCRFAAVRGYRAGHLGHARRADARRAAERLHRRQFLARRRHQRHMGFAGNGE